MRQGALSNFASEQNEKFMKTKKLEQETNIMYWCAVNQL